MSCKNCIFEYEPKHVVVINDKFLNIIYNLLRVCIICYAFGYSICLKEGYLDFYGLSSSVLIKVRGIAVSNRSDIQRDIWDIADIVIPPQEENGVFITTNAIETVNQTQGICPEDPTVESSICIEDNNCVKNKPLHEGHGVMTGRCIPTTGNIKTCEVRAWCPIENDTLIWNNKPMLKEVTNFTIFIKNIIIFDDIDVQRSNLIEWATGVVNKTCNYDATDTVLRYCPIFNISSLIGPINETEWSKMLTFGGVIRIIITWNCNLMRGTNNCRPEYSFTRLDSIHGDYSKGWNFRYANYYEINNQEYRTLFKVFGLRILIEVRGKAGVFSPVTTSMNVGSGLALLCIATKICNFLIQKVPPFTTNYKKHTQKTISKKNKTKPMYIKMKRVNIGTLDFSRETRQVLDGTFFFEVLDHKKLFLWPEET